MVFEYPFNESVRTLLRLEHLLQRLGTLVAADAAVGHHFALVTLFEIMDVASRADLKSDLLQELDRQRKQLAAFRGNPAISETALDTAIAEVDTAWQGLSEQPGKAGQSLNGNDWLMSIRSRISIPGGTCSFDLPSYHAWQHLPAPQRRADLERWAGTLAPLAQALTVALRLMRASGQSHQVTATGGRYQQPLGNGRPVQLARVRLADEAAWVPEISGNRLLLSIRTMRADADGRLEPLSTDQPFELVLCS